MDSRPLLVPFQSLQLDSSARLNLGIYEKKTLLGFADDDPLGHGGFSASTFLLSVQMLLGHKQTRDDLTNHILTSYIEEGKYLGGC